MFQVSARLAVCNMDWDRLKAKDLLALFSSFVPEGGAVLSVKVTVPERRDPGFIWPCEAAMLDQQSDFILPTDRTKPVVCPE